MSEIINWIKAEIGIDLTHFGIWLKETLGLELNELLLVGITILLTAELVFYVKRKKKKSKALY
jgi:LPXTG-motif cell wall-anchored protein